LALPILERYLRRRGAPWAQDLIWDACTRTILDHCDRPEAWHRNQRSLLGYLEMSSIGDFRNALDSRLRKSGLENLCPPVELPELRRNSSAEDEWLDRIDVDGLVKQYAAVLPDQSDQSVFRLMLLGFRDEADFSIALGIADQPETERRRVIKQTKDRIKKRIQRAGRDVE
jgi:hypothetical protein